MSPTGRRALAWGLAGAAIVAALGAWAWPFTIDDAYIPCRYARHLAEGRGLVWQPGERAAGGTGLAWTRGLAGAHAAGVRDLPAVAKAAGLLAALAVVFVVVARARRAAGGRRGGALVTLLLAAPSLSTVVYGVAGLETCAFALAVTVAAIESG